MVALNNAAQSLGRDKSTLLKFSNRRAEFHWRMREALDPEADIPAAIPPDPELLADLTAPRFTVRSSGIVVEPKIEIKKRIGRSPDKGEAAMYANVDSALRLPQSLTQTALAHLPAHIREALAHVAGDGYDNQRLRELG